MSSNIVDRIKAEFKPGSELKQLLIINGLFYISLNLAKVFLSLLGLESVFNIIFNTLILPGDISEILFQPWSIITNIFVHIDFFHFLWNMVMLYYLGKFFELFFSGNRLIITYVIGGVIGAFAHVLSYKIFPVFAKDMVPSILGASGAIYAIMGAILYHRPKLEVQLFFGIKVEFWVIAGLLILSNLFSLAKVDGIAYFAHVGGAVLGIVSVININDKKQLFNRLEQWWKKFSFRNIFEKKKPKFKVHRNEDFQKMSDDEYRSVKKQDQERIDAILDKISKGGYESLTKREKEFLFKHSNE